MAMAMAMAMAQKGRSPWFFGEDMPCGAMFQGPSDFFPAKGRPGTDRQLTAHRAAHHRREALESGGHPLPVLRRDVARVVPEGLLLHLFLLLCQAYKPGEARLHHELGVVRLDGSGRAVLANHSAKVGAVAKRTDAGVVWGDVMV